MAATAAAVTASASVAECDKEPDVPLTVTVALPVAADAPAVNVIDCGVPGVRVNVDGLTVTPVGSPATETPIVPENPLRAAAETEADCPVAPACTLKLVGLRVREKSGKGAVAAVTVSIKVAVCDSVPEVPVTVTVVVPAAAAPDADSVMDSGVPGCTESVAGATVTPAGSPVRATDTALLKPFDAVAETEIDCPAPPACTLKLLGLRVREKSGEGAVAAVTVSVKVVVCDSIPEVPVTVTDEVPAAAAPDADSVMDSGVPGCTESVAGAAVTPAGSPVRARDTAPLKTFDAVAETAIC